MAGNKVNTKSKSKEEKARMSKGSSPSHSTGNLEDGDFSLLRKPLVTSISSFAQAIKLYDLATAELKTILTNECDLLYECKVCRNIFRSIANLLCHKRIYCKEKFNPTANGRFLTNSSLSNEISKIKRMEQIYQESLRNKQTNDSMEMGKTEDRIPLTKDITTVAEKITAVMGISEPTLKEKLQQLSLQTIPTSKVAVFQNIIIDGEDSSNGMRAQVNELHTILSQDKAVLQSDGKFTTECSSSNIKGSPDSEGVIQISDDEEADENNTLKCKICHLQFSTQKTLKFHMKHKHLESRLVYLCPDCLDSFSTSWSVYRHLYKVHRKSAAYIKRQRETVQAKAFRMDNPPAYYEKRKNNLKALASIKVSDAEKIGRENKAWMDNMEGDGEVPRCGGCGRTFERRAALAAHTHTCQPRHRALARRPLDPKRIEFQIRKGSILLPQNHKTSIDTTSAQNEQESEKSVDVESADTTLNRTLKTQKITDVKVDSVPDATSAENQNLNENKNSNDVQNVALEALSSSEIHASSNSDSTIEQGLEIQNIQGKEDTKTETENSNQNDEIVLAKNFGLFPDQNLQCSYSNVPFYKRIEQNNLVGLKHKMEPDVEMNNLLCKKCDIKLRDMKELFYHMSGHYKWKRYCCRLCNFRNYYWHAVIEHIKTVHKIKGDREFYYTTVKALSATDAVCNDEANAVHEMNDVDDTSNFVSRRPSRCSSRSSDDSCSSNMRTEQISNKRRKKSNQNQTTTVNKKDSSLITPKKGETLEQKSSNISLDKVMQVIFGDTEMSSEYKVPSQEILKEDYSSDVDDTDEKFVKKIAKDEAIPTGRICRPVRKRTRLLNDDYEYDLSNLLKKEAQGHREQVNVNLRPGPMKRKSQIDLVNYDVTTLTTSDPCGALLTMTKKYVEGGRAKIILLQPSAGICNNTGFKQYVPKTQLTPKGGTPNAQIKTDNTISIIKSIAEKSDSNLELVHESNTILQKDSNCKDDFFSKPGNSTEENVMVKSAKDQDETIVLTNTETTMSSVIPTIQLSHQSLEVIKNPLVSQNITEFTKLGMKTKFLVIKPIKGTAKPQTLQLPTSGLKDVENKTKMPTIDHAKIVKIPRIDKKIVSQSNSENILAKDTDLKENGFENVKVVDVNLDTKKADIAET